MEIPEIDVTELAERRDEGAPLIDVRQLDEWEDYRVPDAVLVPLAEVPERAAEIPSDGTVYVICKTGGRSARAVGAGGRLPPHARIRRGQRGRGYRRLAGRWSSRRPRRLVDRVPNHRWVDTDDALVALVDELRDEPELALDTEFHRERTYFPHVALVQIGWPGGIALLDALAMDVRPLAALLDGDRTIVMHAAQQDLEVLLRACRRVPDLLFDTQLAAGFCGYGTPSLAALLQGELGIKLPKGDRLTDWLRRPLADEQREYAASDVEHLLPLAARLRARLDRDGRTDWVVDEASELRARSLDVREPNEAWWRIKEARSLRGRAAGVAQNVAAWRERRAVETNQPARFVLPDLALVGVAQRPPTTLDQLRAVRGLDERHVRGSGGRELLTAIAEGAELPRERLRLPPTSDVDRQLRPAVTLVSAWVSQLARDLGIDTALIATRADIEALLRGEHDARLTRGWRADVVGEAVRKLVGGDAALAFAGSGRLVLEARSHRPLA
ncbi:MAG: HRDC domain-containing protein [Acidimicrobiales bacterium]